MDQDKMQRALQAVLGEGYEADALRTANGSGSASPSPHDFLQGRVVRKDAVGSDLHVPTTISAPSQVKTALKPVRLPKRQGKFRMAVVAQDNSVEKSIMHPSQNAQAKIGEGLTTAGAAGGVLSLPSLAGHTMDKVKQMKTPLAAGDENAKVGAGIASKIGAHLKPLADASMKLPGAEGTLRALKNPKVGAGMAVGAAGLEVAGLAGDVMARHNFKQQRVAKSEEVTFSKVDDDKRQVFGWVSLSKKNGEDVIDLQGDIVPIEEIEKSAYDYMLKSRKAGNQHARVYSRLGDELVDDPKHVGDVIESVVFTPEKIEKMGLPADHDQGWWMGMQIFDEDTWQQIKSGERGGFSIHGKGRRELVEKKADRTEQVKDTALGVSGATAAASGAGATLIPKIAAKTGKDVVRAEKVSGKLKLVGATLGGTAGVYGGIHAAHRAAKGQNPAYQPLPGSGGGLIRKDWTEYDMERKQRSQGEVAGDTRRFLAERDDTGRNHNTPAVPARVAGKWSPVVHQPSLESNRTERSKAYEAGAAGASAGLGAAAGIRGAGALRARRDSKPWTDEQVEHVQQVQREKALRDLRGRLDAKPNKRGNNFLVDNHLKAKGKSAADIRALADKHNLETGKNALRAGKLARKAGVLGAGAVAAGAVAEGIHHRRTGSWRPYPGVQ